MRTPTSDFVKSLFEKAVNKKSTGLTLDLTSFGECGDESLSVGPHPGFEPTSFVMSFESGEGTGWQCAFAEDDVDNVQELIEALQGWVEFIEENRLGDKDK